MEGANEKDFSRYLRAFVASDVRVMIDDLRLTICFRTSHHDLLRFYEVGHIPTEVLRVLHFEENT